MQPGYSRRYAIEFTGSGREYFNIWIVNLLLSVLTLGIYSAWAKVRRLQYFYRNTRIADASFEYHGLPMAILKGRIIAFIILMLYSLAGRYNLLLGLAAAALIGLVMPWLIVRSLRFKLHYSSYRGLRFAFVGSDKAAYRVFLLNPILAAITVYLLVPFAHQRIKQYQHRNSKFGNTFFTFGATVGSFYRVYLKALLAALLLGILVVFLAKLFMLRFIVFLIPVIFICIAVYMAVALPNLIWNATGLGDHAFYCNLRMRPYLWIGFTNLLGIIVTLGLFVPFAQVRMLRYKLECMGLIGMGDLAGFVAGQTQEVSALGQETSEIFNMDISL